MVDDALAPFNGNKFLLYLLLIFTVLQAPLLLTPPDRTHTWRQCDTAAVARNFQEENPNIFTPRIDARKNTNGITGMEFPLFNYIVFLSYKAFGFSHSTGKWISFIFGILCLILFHRLVLLLKFDLAMANISTMMMAASTLFFHYSGKVMPETTALFLHLSSLVIFIKALSIGNEKEENISIVLVIFSAVLLSFSALVRPYHSIAGLFMAYLAFKKFGWSFMRKWEAYLFFILAGSPFVYWYFVYVPYLNQINNLNTFYLGTGLGDVISMILGGRFDFLRMILKVFPEDTIGWGEAIIFIAGIFCIVKTKFTGVRQEIWAVVIFVITYIIIITFKTGDHYFGHTYYLFGIVPYYPLIVAWLTLSIFNYWKLNSKKWSLILVAIIFIGFAGKFGYKYSRDHYPTDAIEAGKIVDTVVPIGEKVGVNDGGKPIKLYYFHRKGWALSLEDMLNPAIVQSLKDKKLQYLVYWDANGLSADLIKKEIEPSKIWSFPEHKLHIAFIKPVTKNNTHN